MSGPIVFISHFRIKEGQSTGFERFFREGTAQLQQEKPQTLVFAAYSDEARTRASIIHVFADAQAMDVHVQGAEERSRAAYEFLEPQGFEIYGAPSDAVTEMFRQAASSEAEASFEPIFLEGFLRLRPSDATG